jgi:hypothetical protein
MSITGLPGRMPCDPEGKKIIRVGIPSYNGQLTSHTLETMLLMLRADVYCDYYFDIIIAPGCLTLGIARNYCVSGKNYSRFQKMPFDYYLSVDADISFTLDKVYDLIKCDKRVVSASYLRRSVEFKNRIVAGNWTEKPGLTSDDKFLPDIRAGLQLVDWVGMGCCLIKREVFESLEYPYFRHDIIDNAAGERFILTDDIGFCKILGENGILVYVDTNCTVNHHF